jgi:hypothetical protein
MHHGCRTDATHFFYRPFYETKRGHIVGLATTVENIRDGLPISQVARLFPLFEYEGILVEPGRRSIQPGQNLIVVGWHSLFIDADPKSVSGRELPASVGTAKFGRIVRLSERCCLRINGKLKRAVVNAVTKRRYEPFRPERGDRRSPEIDFGVIRRCFRGPTENTIVMEGLHRLGTLAAAKVATDPVFLKAVLDAIRKLDGYDEAAPLEILVRGEFDADDDEIYSLARVRAVPVAMVYNAQWIYDFTDGLEWRDQLPWNVHIAAAGEADAQWVPSRHRDTIVPRLELRADFRDLEVDIPRLCRGLLGRDRRTPAEREPPPADAATRLIEALIAHSDSFDIELWDASRKGEKPWVRYLPEGAGTAIRGVRTRFLIHLVLCRLLGCPFRVTAANIRRNYPDFQRELKGKTPVEQDRDLEGRFIGQVAGRLGEGFAPLVGSARKKKNYLSRRFNRATRSYTLKLERAVLVLKLRF